MMSYVSTTIHAFLAILISLLPVALLSLLSLALIRTTSLSQHRPLTDEERQQKLSEIAQRVKRDRKEAENRARSPIFDAD